MRVARLPCRLSPPFCRQGIYKRDRTLYIKGPVPFSYPFSFRRRQHDPGTDHQSSRRTASSRPALQGLPLVIIQCDAGCNSHGLILHVKEKTRKANISYNNYETLH
jgi:hypothetical protein